MAQLDNVLIDTDILIDVLRGKQDAVNFMKTLANASTSAITVAELYVGVRDNEKKDVKALLDGMTILSLTHDIAMKGGLYCRDYKDNHGTGFADGLIAAMAEHYDLTLITRNTRHFPMLKKIHRPY